MQATAVMHSDQEWRQLLTPGQYNVLRKGGTELPFSSPLNKVAIVRAWHLLRSRSDKQKVQCTCNCLV